MSKIGQNFNSAGIGSFLQLLGGDKALAVPHISVQDIRYVHWGRLAGAGFQGVVFDKDNTLTEPFQTAVDPRLLASLAECKQAFKGKVVLYSNSAGLKQYDPEGHEAAELESVLGIHVLRHEEKKPAGGKKELEEYFGCPATELVMVGDRYLTDIVFGNRHGMFTVRPAPLTTKGEPTGVVMARWIEDSFVGRWTKAGVRAPPQRLLMSSETPASEFVLDAPPDGQKGA